MGFLASFQNPIGAQGEPRGHSQCKPGAEGECRKAEPVCHHITVALFQISRHGLLPSKLGRGGFGEQGELKEGIKEWAGDERRTGHVHHPAPSPCAWLGPWLGGSPSFCFANGQKPTKLKSFLRFLLSARHEEGDGECTVH